MIKVNGADPVQIGKGAIVPVTQALVKDVFGFGNVKVVEEDKTDEVGGLGLPVWGSVTLADGWKGGGRGVAGKRYNGYSKNGVYNPLSEMYIPCCIVDVVGSNIISKTEIQGSSRRGTVKEYITEGDYQISIYGVLSNNDNKWPENLVTHLDSFKKANIAIPVANVLLTKLGINSIVIENIKWVSKQGFKNIQAFELTAISDEDVEFEYYAKKKIGGSSK